jgi:diguanylate cyclase (GGDEF)-like protein
MSFDIQSLLNADTSKAVEIADRIWWVGHILADDVFQCHVYLLEQGDQSVLFDPGSRLTFGGTLRKIEQVTSFSNIRYFVCHHQDPDITACLPIIDELIDRPDAVLVTHWRTHALLRHYALTRLPFWLVDEHDWHLNLPDRELKFIFTPYAHFPGAICSFDCHTHTLFSSDLFGGFTEQPILIATDEEHFEALRPFHEHYMPSNEILQHALTQIEKYPAQLIAPQHGALIPKPLIAFMTKQLQQLDCGIYRLAQENTDIRRLSRLNNMLRDISEAMLLYRDFRDIATRLFELVQQNIPIHYIDYYTALQDERILCFKRENRFSGVFVDDDAPAFCRFLGATREEWLMEHVHDPGVRHHIIHNDIFCEEPRSQQQGQQLAIPLIAHNSNRIDAFAIMTLTQPTAITHELERVIEQLAEPLQVALERETIHRGMDMERERAYQRSIRDALTDLFTRFYMQDVMGRYCSLHDRDTETELAAILLDIDHFKSINDTYGHGAGDRVLRQMAQLLRDSSRNTDVPVRYGGEEFIVFVIGKQYLEPIKIAERLRKHVAHHAFDIGRAEPLMVTASFGVASRARMESLEHLIERADEALYRAKESGRNRVELAAEFSAQLNNE